VLSRIQSKSDSNFFVDPRDSIQVAIRYNLNNLGGEAAQLFLTLGLFPGGIDLEDATELFNMNKYRSNKECSDLI
jgi:hypothetical protein